MADRKVASAILNYATARFIIWQNLPRDHGIMKEGQEIMEESKGSPALDVDLLALRLGQAAGSPAPLEKLAGRTDFQWVYDHPNYVPTVRSMNRTT
jgi:hypothetical protein